MEYRKKHGIYYVSLGGAFPAGAVPVRHPAAPLVILVRRDPLYSRGFWAIDDLGQLTEPEGPAALVPQPAPDDVPRDLQDFVQAHGAAVLNTAFPRGYEFAEAWFAPKPQRLRLTLVGLGDVGGTVLTALKLLGREIEEIRIFDFNEKLGRRYCLELNQVLSLDGAAMPKVSLCREDQLFDCDLFLFTASKGVPPVGQEQGDVRMAQYEANRAMIATYARRARAARFQGLFCQISDPVDLLARAVYLESNRGEAGHYDWQGLLPEQLQGFGLGVMAARALYYAEDMELDLQAVRAYGPHGAGLVVANRPDDGYDEDLSQRLTTLAKEANLRVRDLGFKPYIAPALSSAAVSLLQLVRGQYHYGAVPLGSAYFGCRSRFTALGLQTQREPLHPDLFARLEQAYRDLTEER